MAQIKSAVRSAAARRRHSARSRFIIVMLLPGILAILGFTYYPLARGFIMAFQKYTLWNIYDRSFAGFQNFIDIFSDTDFGMIMGNTLRWVFVSLFFQFTLGFGLALLLKKKFRGSGVYQGLVYVPWAISGFLIGLIWRWLFNGQSGAINDMLMRLGLIQRQLPFLSNVNYALWSCIIANVWYGIAFFAIMIQAALKGVPEDLYEAADIDGASRLQKFCRVTLPYIKPTLVLTTLLRVIWILNFPDLIYGMTQGGPANSSHILSTYMMDFIMTAQDYGRASAVGVIIMVILASYTCFYLGMTKFEESGDF